MTWEGEVTLKFEMELTFQIDEIWEAESQEDAVEKAKDDFWNWFYSGDMRADEDCISVVEVRSA